MKRFLQLRLALCALLCMPLAAMADPVAIHPDSRIIYVKGNADGIGDGSSWEKAYRSLSTALVRATRGTEIWVAAGENEYVPATQGDDRTVTFLIPEGVAVYGGFAGTESSLEERDRNTYETILSGDLGAGLYAYHVVTLEGGTLDGFTVTGGKADYADVSFHHNKGAGVYMTGGTLRNNGIVGNWAGTDALAGCGAGVFAIGENAIVLENNTIADNHNVSMW